MLNTDPQPFNPSGPNLINDGDLSSEEDIEEPEVKVEEAKTLAQKIDDLVAEHQQPGFNSDFINYISNESLQPVGTITKTYGEKSLLIAADLDSLKKVGILDLNNFVFVLESNIPALLGYVSDVLGQIESPFYQIQRHSASNIKAELDVVVYISMMKIKTLSMQEIMLHKGRDFELDQNGNVVTQEEDDSDQEMSRASQKKKKSKKKNKPQTPSFQPGLQEQHYRSYNQPYVMNPQLPQVPFTAYAPSAYHVMSTPSPYSTAMLPQQHQYSLPPGAPPPPYTVNQVQYSANPGQFGGNPAHPVGPPSYCGPYSFDPKQPWPMYKKE